MKKFNTVEEYYESFPASIQKILKSMRTIIKKACPEAEEVISYNMPAFKFKKVLVYYAAWKEHIGFYPTTSPLVIFKKELIKYKCSKGAIQFEIGKPLPEKIITKIVKFRVKEISSKEKRR